MANKDLRRTPYSISAGIWCYEEEKGINVYKADPDGITRNFLITWRYLRGALKRKDKS